MAKQTNITNFLKKPKVKRPNVHAKTKARKLQPSKNYNKLYPGQGK